MGMGMGPHMQHGPHGPMGMQQQHMMGQQHDPHHYDPNQMQQQQQPGMQQQQQPGMQQQQPGQQQGQQGHQVCVVLPPLTFILNSKMKYIHVSIYTNNSKYISTKQFFFLILDFLFQVFIPIHCKL